MSPVTVTAGVLKEVRTVRRKLVGRKTFGRFFGGDRLERYGTETILTFRNHAFSWMVGQHFSDNKQTTGSVTNVNIRKCVKTIVSDFSECFAQGGSFRSDFQCETPRLPFSLVATRNSQALYLGIWICTLTLD